MSDVETYWQAIRSKMGDSTPPEWNKLGMHKQMMVINSINLLLQVVFSNE